MLHINGAFKPYAYIFETVIPAKAGIHRARAKSTMAPENKAFLQPQTES